MTDEETIIPEPDKDQIAVLREQFHVFDLNGNGYIELDELKEGLKRLGYQINDDGLIHLFQLVGIRTDIHRLYSKHEEGPRMNFEQFITWNRELFLWDMKDKFHQIDTDSSGWISRQELMDYYSTLEMPYSEDEIDDFLYQADFNEDGKMQLDEFIAAMATSEGGNNAFFVLNGEMFLAKLKHEFTVMDANGDGFVTREELQRGSTLSAEEIELTFQQLDTDGDGKISLEEFIASAVSAASTKQRRLEVLPFHLYYSLFLHEQPIVCPPRQIHVHVCFCE